LYIQRKKGSDILDEKVRIEVSKVTKGILVLDILVIIILLAISKFNMPMLVGLLFGSVIAILNFRLLALSLQKTLSLPPNRAQIYSTTRYVIRFIITALVVFISVKATYINIIGTLIGLTGPTIVILVTNLLFNKNKIIRKEA
jgi:hypothetical protein